MVWLVMFSFFVISFLTNILGPILPDAKKDLHLSLAMAGILPFAFFIAYGIMSIPAGYLVEKYKEKKSEAWQKKERNVVERCTYGCVSS